MSFVLQGALASPDRPSPGDHCPISRALDVVGTRSAMLLMREAMYGTARFDDFARRVGISDAVASARLRELVDAGLLERTPYQEEGQRTRMGYVLTPKGADLVPVALALAAWGNRHTGDGAGVAATHEGCGATVTTEVRCAAGHDVPLGEVAVRPTRTAVSPNL